MPSTCHTLKYQMIYLKLMTLMFVFKTGLTHILKLVLNYSDSETVHDSINDQNSGQGDFISNPNCFRFDPSF